ncbi:MobH family relaxase [Burkholderia multivorans]|uniref:MobH family relaxase n=1 Tax=Burkholderia multivorans TaxID=87883 RepID=UPI001C243E64|nr:MobH family relaxase [Burkholderia multivorans]MBU9211614.1 TraI domain-containing protein [Burkholderia multivorans]
MQWRDDEIPRYPPFMKGLPAVSPEKLLETQAELIERIADTAISLPAQFERYYLSAIERFARFAHLLPASQSHHHRGAGGLLRHSIEVGLWALQSADKVLLDAAKTPSQRREMEPRWQLAVFLAALCHDAGKPVTDLIVTNKDRTAIWKPIKEDLYAWAMKNGIEAYFLDWREGRARQHTALSNLIADRIIGAETLEWIEEGGTELIVWLMESLTCNPSPTNLIHDLVIKADQTSVERDLKTLGVAMAGYDLGVPVERHLTDIMRRFIKEGVWLINEPGARLWNIGGNIYLVWPAAGEEIARQVREDGIPGIPRTPDGILDMLVERQIAFIREGAAPGDRLWKIAPAILAEKIPDIKLPAIRLRDEAMVSSAPIPSVDGRIVNEQENDHEEFRRSQNERSEVSILRPTSQRPVAPAEQIESPEEKTTPGSFGEAKSDSYALTCAVMDHASEHAVSPEEPAVSKPDADLPRTPQPVRSAPSMPGVALLSGAADTKATKTSGASFEQAKRSGQTSEAKFRSCGQPTIVLDGAVGEALKALAQDLKSGDKRWGVDVVIDADQHVLLRWPDAFSGYGLTAKSILDELGSREWLWIDPMAPLKKVMEAQFGGDIAKAIRLTPEISQTLIREAGAALDGGHIESEVKNSPCQEAKKKPAEPENSQMQAKPVKQGRKPKREAINFGEKTSVASFGEAKTTTGSFGEAKTQRRNEQPGKTPASVDGGTDGDQGAGDVAESAGLPSVDDVIAVIKDLQAAVQSDGYLLINKQDVLAACKKRGLRITHRRLWELGSKDPDRLSVDGGVVRFKL